MTTEKGRTGHTMQDALPPLQNRTPFLRRIRDVEAAWSQPLAQQFSLEHLFERFQGEGD